MNTDNISFQTFLQIENKSLPYYVITEQNFIIKIKRVINELYFLASIYLPRNIIDFIGYDKLKLILHNIDPSRNYYLKQNNIKNYVVIYFDTCQYNDIYELYQLNEITNKLNINYLNYNIFITDTYYKNVFTKKKH